MKRIQTTTFLIFILLWVLRVFAQSSDKPSSIQKEAKKGSSIEAKFVGFVDKDKDGINDKFCDANGDGKNDVDGKEYPHKFEFKDKNKDKINDLWMDRDGDGVNDLILKFKGKSRQKVQQNVLDVNADGRNDITGIKYDKGKHRWMGEKWGFWDEQKGKLQGRFIDEDGDGIDDRMKGFSGFMGNHKGSTRMRDMFIDEDGDGIADGRDDFISKMGRCGRGGNQNRQKGHGGHH